MTSGTKTVATMIHGPTWVVKSATDGGFCPGATDSIEVMNEPRLTIAQSQQIPTIASAVKRTVVLTSPACSSPCSITPEGGRCVSGAVAATTISSTTSAAMIK